MGVVYSAAMTTERTKRLLGLLATLAAAAILATGCGSDNKKSDSGGATPNVGTTSTDAPKTKSDAVQRCKDEANKLSGDAKDTALASCKAIETGNTSDVKAKAKKQCLDATKQITDANARKQAEAACNKFN
jgi:hypothetical protein